MTRPSHTLSDTHPDAQRTLIEMAREAPAWQKAYMAGRMYETVKYLALVGLRQRYPAAGEPELHRRLADLMLGPELAARAYGPPPAEGPQNAS